MPNITKYCERAKKAIKVQGKLETTDWLGSYTEWLKFVEVQHKWDETNLGGDWFKLRIK